MICGKVVKILESSYSLCLCYHCYVGLVAKIRNGRKMCLFGDLLLGIFSFLLLQEEPRVVASTGEQSKARSDKQKFGKDHFSKQEKKQVRRKQEEMYGHFFLILDLISKDLSFIC